MKTRVLALLGVLFFFAVASAEHTRWYELTRDYKFENYLQEFNKEYSDSQEFQLRKQRFEEKLAKIMRHNMDKTKTWKEGVNQYTDWTEEEFSRVLGYNKNWGYAQTSRRDRYNYVDKKMKIQDLPSTVDWRTKGIVSPVKDQGECGSCWSFASAETVECYAALKSGNLAILSEQQILGCTQNPQDCGGTGGCGGGTVEVAYASIINVTFGLSTEWTYPYVSYYGTNFPCMFSKSTTPPAAYLTNYTKLPSNEYTPLLTAVATDGPIAISVDASSWSDYESGVYNGCNQTNPDIDHAVQLVGYGTDTTLNQEYWLVRNSWAPTWGEHGYIRLYRTSTVQCGIDLHPSDGDGCKNGPPTVKVCGTCGILYDSVFPIMQGGPTL